MATIYHPGVQAAYSIVSKYWTPFDGFLTSAQDAVHSVAWLRLCAQDGSLTNCVDGPPPSLELFMLLLYLDDVIKTMMTRSGITSCSFISQFEPPHVVADRRELIESQ